MVNERDNFYRYAAKVEILKRGKFDVVLYNIETDIKKKPFVFLESIMAETKIPL